MDEFWVSLDVKAIQILTDWRQNDCGDVSADPVHSIKFRKILAQLGQPRERETERVKTSLLLWVLRCFHLLNK